MTFLLMSPGPFIVKEDDLKPASPGHRPHGASSRQPPRVGCTGQPAGVPRAASSLIKRKNTGVDVTQVEQSCSDLENGDTDACHCYQSSRMQQGR
jgi:hypothetical protein